jgi:hypothetical protein
MLSIIRSSISMGEILVQQPLRAGRNRNQKAARLGGFFLSKGKRSAPGRLKGDFYEPE